MPELDVPSPLFGWPDAANGVPIPGESFPQAFEQYKLYLELTDRLSQRRQTANSFFIGLNTAIVALLGYANAEKEPIRAEHFCLLIALTGVILCYLWYRIIQSYRIINTARFAVIRAIESFLPLRPYSAEWDFMGRIQRSKYYRPSHVEISVPWLFFVLYLVVLLWNIPWLFIFRGV